MKVVLTKQSLNYLVDNLRFYLEELKIPKTKVLAIRKQLITKARNLSKQPFKGQKEEYLAGADKEYRRIIEGDFKIVYYIKEETVYVTDFFHTHRDPNT